jgi:hypothetical protein
MEAALTIKLHADLLPWSHEIQLEAVPEFGFSKWQTAFDRKEQVICSLSAVMYNVALTIYSDIPSSYRSFGQE